MKIDKPGIYHDMASGDYFADPCPLPSLTQSIAKTLLGYSPAHARLEHPKLAPPIADEDAEPEKYMVAQAIGNAAHALLIGRGKTLAVADFPNWKTKDAQTFKADALLHDRTPILTKHMARAYAMVKATRDQLDAAGHKSAFLAGAGSGEVVIAWQEDGLWFRSMLDWVDGKWPKYFDFKSTGLSCAPHVVIERPSELGWDIQAAMHDRGLDVLAPDYAGRREFYFIAQENELPYALTPIRLSNHDLTMGHKKLQFAIDIWRDCMATGKWPAYPAETIHSRPRPWLESKFLEREIERDERRHEPMLTDLSGG